MHALLFDLDGTLVDTVYAHVLAWQQALGEVGVAVDGYRADVQHAPQDPFVKGKQSSFRKPICRKDKQ